MSTSADAPVLVNVEGYLGRITLNRPEALNALTLGMVRIIDNALEAFADDSRIVTVVIDGAGDRALCAGGDIRSIHTAALAGDPSPRVFWAEEYRLNAVIARYRKPIVAIMDRIVMGGGVGISAHASHRVVTERSLVAMPEVGIGFAPDVGGTWLLSRAPGEVGTHLALTAARINAADAIYSGLADHYVPSDDLDNLLNDLTSGHPHVVFGGRHADPGPASLETDRSWIDDCYRGDSVEEILGRLRDQDGHGATAAEAIASMSPTSLKVTLRALREARELPSLERCLEMEHRISSTFLDTPDFIEGVRAAVVDKDRQPKWNPADLESVNHADVERFFVPRQGDLQLDTHR